MPTIFKRKSRYELVKLCILAIIIGVVTGFGAIFFRLLIALIHNAAFLGVFSWEEISHVPTQVGVWGPLVILVPIIGGLGVVYLVKTFAPEARGHGVPEVMDAVYYKEGKIRPVVAVVKSLASALSIGTGASVGREGPIIQIGSSFGSSLAQLLGLAPWQRITLLASGAGAGIAATFNTPLGGVMFAVELLMPEVSSRTFLPVVLATATATYVGRMFFGMAPAFTVPLISDPVVDVINLPELGGFILLGVVIGLGAVAFIRLLSYLEDVFPSLPVNIYVQNIIGMAIIGTAMYVLSLVYGQYFIEGAGYVTIQGILDDQFNSITILAVLFIAKLLATTISLGSGASGGVFSPSLFLGSTLGGLVGAILAYIWPDGGFSVGEFALVGMAAMVGGATGAAMTAIVMIFEMTRDYNLIVPMVTAVALAIGVRRALSPENIYTIKLVGRGHRIPKERHTNMFLVRHAGNVMDERFLVLPVDTGMAAAAAQVKATEPRPHYVIFHEGDHIKSVVPYETYFDSSEETGATVRPQKSLRFVLARPTDILHDVLKRLGHGVGGVALVVENKGVPRINDVRGVISLENIGEEVLRHFRQ
ncbi:MAG: chloride channel protein [Alphaproteobacteria bacterium]|nr:chloride channel protein [Alphaproteobacteria bacterium]